MYNNDTFTLTLNADIQKPVFQINNEVYLDLNTLFENNSQVQVAYTNLDTTYNFSLLIVTIILIVVISNFIIF